MRKEEYQRMFKRMEREKKNRGHGEREKDREEMGKYIGDKITGLYLKNACVD